MKKNTRIRFTKIGILILFMMIGAAGCTRKNKTDRATITRFEDLVFTIPTSQISDSIHLKYSYLIPFFTVFNESIIRIGPDSLTGYPNQLERFVKDTMIRSVYSEVKKSSASYQESCRQIDIALSRLTELTGKTHPAHFVTYLSGFNQTFITLPGCMGIGVDNYLGSTSSFYQSLGIPMYTRKNMNPENLTTDAVRAWLYSELPLPASGDEFLERMIYEGKLYYIAKKLLPKTSEEILFHYTKEQLNWCKEQEKSMWKYLAEQKILFSTNRLTISKFHDDAPFTRDFGNESPGKVGVWIGYRIVSSYMKATGISLKDLVEKTSGKEILSASKYHP